MDFSAKLDPPGRWGEVDAADAIEFAAWTVDHPRLADRLIAADKDFELLIVPGAEHTFIDCLAYVRKRCWDFLVRELMGTQPPAYRPAPIAIGPELLGELFA